MYIHELRVSYVPREPVDDVVTVKTARDAASLMAPLLELEVVEVCYVLCLATPLTLIGYHQLSRGSLNTTLVHPREVFKVAIMVNAAAIVLAHNHPSGDPRPSSDDLQVTLRVKNAGEVIGIELLDHIIVGHQNRFVSIREQGRL